MARISVIIFLVKDLPRNSSGVPATSVSRPVRNGHQNHHQRTSSNASTNSKRGK